MYTQTFFFLLHDSWRNLTTSRSDSSVEHTLYKELASAAYAPVRKAYLAESQDFPEVHITNCSVLGRNLGLLTTNNAIEF